MKRAFFLVSALFVLFQLGEKVTAASIEASSGNTESDQQSQIQNVEDLTNKIVDGVLDSLNNGVDSFQSKFDDLHQFVAGIIKDHEPSDEAPEIVKNLVQGFESFFDNGHAQLIALIDQFQAQGVQGGAALEEGAKKIITTIISNINAARGSSESSTA